MTWNLLDEGSDWNNMALYSCWSVDTDIISILLDKHRCGSSQSRQDPISFGKSSGISSSLCTDGTNADATAYCERKKWYVADGHLFVRWKATAFYCAIVERKMRFQTPRTYTEISELSTLYRTYITHMSYHTDHMGAQGISHFDFRKHIIKTNKIRSHTHSAREASRRGAIFRWNIQHHYYIVSLIFGNMFPIQQTILVKYIGGSSKSTPLKTFGLRMRVDVHFHRVSSPLRLGSWVERTQLLRACCHAISVKMMKVYPQPQVKFW